MLNLRMFQSVNTVRRVNSIDAVCNTVLLYYSLSEKSAYALRMLSMRKSSTLLTRVSRALEEVCAMQHPPARDSEISFIIRAAMPPA